MKLQAWPLFPSEGPRLTFSHVRNLSLTVVAVMAIIAGLWFTQDVLILLILGLIISYALNPFVVFLRYLKIPRSVGSALLLLTLVTGIGFGMRALSTEIMDVINTLPLAAQKLRIALRDSRDTNGGVIQKVHQAATELDKATTESIAAPPPKGVLRVQVEKETARYQDYLWAGGFGALGFLGKASVVFFLVYFMLFYGTLFKKKFVKIMGSELSQKKITLQMIEEINQQIERFLFVQILAAAIVGITTWLLLWALGMENAAVWGLLAGVFNTIPYFGPALVSVGLGIVAFVQFDTLSKAMLIVGVSLVITTLEGVFLTPSLVGKVARMNSLAVLIGLVFWGWLWGVPGMLLAAPMMMILKTVSDHVEELKPISELLGE